MSVFTAAIELLGTIGESSELTKLGSQSQIFNTIENELNALVLGGESVQRAREIVEQRYQPNLNGAVRIPSDESQNQDFIQNINRNVRENTARERRPLNDENILRQRRPISEQIPLLQDVPLNETIMPRLPRPIRRPTVRQVLRPSIAGAAGAATIGQIINNPSNTGTRGPINQPGNTTNPIDIPITTQPETIKETHPAISGIPNDISNNLLSPINLSSDDLIYNLHVHGAYKQPPYHWHDDSSEDYMYQSLYNAFSGTGPLY